MLMRTNQEQIDVNSAVVRLLWVIDRSPAECKPKLTFLNGTAMGTLTWLEPDEGDGQDKRYERWVNPPCSNHTNFFEVLADFTDTVMRYVYGVEGTQCDETQRNDAVVIKIRWKGAHWDNYMGFETVKSMNSWLYEHDAWLTYERVR